MLKFLIALSMIISLLRCETAITQELKLDFIAVDEPPLNYLDKNQIATGYSVALVNLIQTELGLDSKIHFLPESRALKFAQNTPNTIIFSLSRTPEREEQYYWLQQVAQKNWVLYARTDSIRLLKNINDINYQESVAVVRGDIREQWLNNHPEINKVASGNYQTAVELLAMKRVDYLLYESVGMSIVAESLNYPKEKFSPALKVNSSDVYIAISKKELDLKLVTKITAAIENLNKSGELQKLTEEWAFKLRKKYFVECWVEDGVLKY